MVMRIGINFSGGAQPNTAQKSYEQPFLNKFKLTGDQGSGFSRWIARTAAGGSYNDSSINFDSIYGVPINMSGKTGSAADGQTFNRFTFTVLKQDTTQYQTNPWFKTGNYVFLYDYPVGSTGANGKFTHSGGTVASWTHASALGRFVFPITNPLSDGIVVEITNVGSGPITNLRLVHEDHESLLEDDGEIFDPDLTRWLEPLTGPLRFQNFTMPNVGTTPSGSFPDPYNTVALAPDPAGMFYSPVMPWMVCVALCNKVNKDLYIQSPARTDYSVVERMATEIHEGATDLAGRFWPGLNSNLSVYHEYGNEIWNTGASIYTAAQIANAPTGFAAFPAFKNLNATFTAYIDDNSTPGTYSGNPGSVMTVKSSPAVSGTILRENVFQSNNFFGTGVPFASQVRSQSSGTTGKDGTYLVENQSTNALLNVAVPETVMTQGSSFGAYYSLGQMRQIQYNNVFNAVWDSYGDADRHVRVCAAALIAFGVARGKYILGNTPSTAGDGTPQGGYSFAATGCSISGDELTIGTVTSGTPALWQEISGGTTSRATYITENISGSGSGSVWRVNHSQTVASTDMTGAYWTGKGRDNFDAFAINPYMTVQNLNNLGFTTADQFWASDQFSNDIDEIITGLDNMYNQVTQHPSYGNGIPIISYEGGQNYLVSQAISADVNKDTRMYGGYTELLERLEATGQIEIFMHYAMCGPNVLGSTFSCIPNQYAAGTKATNDSPKYAAMVDYINRTAAAGNKMPFALALRMGLWS